MMTEKDILDMLKDYIDSPQGKSDLKSSGFNISGYSEQEMKQIALELRNAIIEAYLSLVKDQGKYFDTNSVKVNSPREQSDGTWKLSVSFPDKVLFRRSLYSDSPKKGKGATSVKTSTGTGYFTGSGVYDIIGLFTQGYSASRSVYGTWWDNQYDDGDRGNLGLIRSLRHRSSNDFVSRTIEAFKLKYPTIEVSYPSEWGGNS